MLNIYVASSWRNSYQPGVVALLRATPDVTVYDFRHPKPGDDGFAWSAIDPAWQTWTPAEFRLALGHPIARAGFKNDADALRACNVCVLVLPCGRSAHLEAGFVAGAGKPVIVYLPELPEPELMYGLCGAGAIVLTEDELRAAVAALRE